MTQFFRRLDEALPVLKTHVSQEQVLKWDNITVEIHTHLAESGHLVSMYLMTDAATDDETHMQMFATYQELKEAATRQWVYNWKKGD